MAKSHSYPSNRLTVIIRDDSPMIHCGDCPTYRSVTLDLTAGQMQKLQLKYTGTRGGITDYETISKCFIEP